ncbi:MAG: EamA family transporter [Parcubacteria group bacterium]|nr:EamA family transporter [Parcubacteria group bacterium]
MNWLFVSIISYFILALVFIVDKFLLSRTALRPLAYAFYVGILGGISSLFLIPFGFSSMPLGQVVISFIAGILFIFAILCFYKSVRLGEVSRITPIIGGAVPIFTFVLTYFFLGERLNFNQLIAFLFFVLGGIILVWPRKKIRLMSGEAKTPLIKRLPLAILASLFFSGSFVLTKFIFMEQSFINGFVWIRLGGILGAVLLLFWPSARQTIFKTSKSIKLKTSGLLVANKTLSALAFILLSYAVYLGSVTLVNALQGIQYVFLLAIALFLSKKFPQIVKEQISQGIVVKKIIAVLFICIGLGVLVF